MISLHIDLFKFSLECITDLVDLTPEFLGTTANFLQHISFMLFSNQVLFVLGSHEFQFLAALTIIE